MKPFRLFALAAVLLLLSGCQPASNHYINTAPSPETSSTRSGSRETASLISEYSDLAEEPEDVESSLPETSSEKTLKPVPKIIGRPRELLNRKSPESIPRLASTNDGMAEDASETVDPLLSSVPDAAGEDVNQSTDAAPEEFGTSSQTTAPAPSPSPLPAASPAVNPVQTGEAGTAASAAPSETTAAGIPTPSPTAVPTAAPSPVTVPAASPSPTPFVPYLAKGILIAENRAMEQFYPGAASEAEYAALVNRVAAVAGVPVYNMLVPTAIEFFGSAEYNTGSRSQKEAIDRVYSKLAAAVPVDAYSVLQSHRSEYLYFRTDHHWTGLGAYYAYTAFAGKAGLTAVPLSSFRPGQIPGSFLGSLYLWSGSVRSLEPHADLVQYWYPSYAVTGAAYTDAAMSSGRNIELIRTDFSGSYKYMAFTDGDHGLARFDSPAGSGRSILVIKESYGNAMVPFLTAHYDHVYVLDPRHIQLDLAEFVAGQDIDEILMVNYTVIFGSGVWKSGLAAALGE